MHPHRGAGRITELIGDPMADGRCVVTYSSGESHRYAKHSWHKLELYDEADFVNDMMAELYYHVQNYLARTVPWNKKEQLLDANKLKGFEGPTGWQKLKKAQAVRRASEKGMNTRRLINTALMQNRILTEARRCWVEGGGAQDTLYDSII